MNCIGHDGMDGVLAFSEALQRNKSVTKLNISGNKIGGYFNGGSDFVPTPEGTNALVIALQTNSTTSELTFSGDHSRSKPLTVELAMSNADFSGKKFECEGAIMLAGVLPKCQALTSLNVSDNSIMGLTACLKPGQYLSSGSGEVNRGDVVEYASEKRTVANGTKMAISVVESMLWPVPSRR